METYAITIKINNVYTLNCDQDTMVVDAMHTVRGKTFHDNEYKTINLINCQT